MEFVFRKKNAVRISVLALLVVCITFFHYRTDHFNISTHIIFRELYFLPIILAGFWFGVRGGIGASLAITIGYLPFVLALPEGISGHNLGNVVQIILFNLFGLVIGLLRDRQMRQQRKLLEAENLAAMGRAVSCIAHDMKSPLVAIGGFVQQVRKKVADDKLTGKLDIALEQISRLENLVGDMLAFARPLNLQCQRSIINHLIDKVVIVSGEKASRHDVTIKTELQEDMPIADYDQHRLEQAILNLVNNALEASPENSEVVIRGKSQDGMLIIEIVDRGEGVPEEKRDEIFTPFVTAKSDGTGLGLPIVKKVIEAHDGSINVIENSGQGVTFQIIIPLTQSPHIDESIRK